MRQGSLNMKEYWIEVQWTWLSLKPNLWLRLEDMEKGLLNCLHRPVQISDLSGPAFNSIRLFWRCPGRQWKIKITEIAYSTATTMIIMYWSLCCIKDNKLPHLPTDATRRTLSTSRQKNTANQWSILRFGYRSSTTTCGPVCVVYMFVLYNIQQLAESAERQFLSDKTSGYGQKFTSPKMNHKGYGDMKPPTAAGPPAVTGFRR